MKGILKKVLGVLKITRVVLPLVFSALFVNGIVQGVLLTEKAKKDVENVKQQILQTEDFVELREQDLKIYQKQYEEGVITSPEYAEKKSYINSTEYVDDVIDLEGFEEQKAILKQAEDDAEVKRGWGIGIAFGFALPTAFSLATACALYISSDGREIISDWAEEGVTDLKYKDPDKKKKEEDILEIRY